MTLQPFFVNRIVQKSKEEASDAPFNSSLFTDVLFRRDSPRMPNTLNRGEFMLSVEAPTVQPHQELVLVGSSSELGQWDVLKSIRLSDAAYPVWSTPSFSTSHSLVTSEFKFVIVDKMSGEVVSWEEGYNRRLPAFEVKEMEAVHMELSAPRFKMNKWRGAGVAIPLFSLRSKESMGIGDFRDLMKMADWAAHTGQKMIQILPINDTTMTGTWQDSYPYNSNSIFALHPQYLSLTEIGKVECQSKQEAFEAEGKRLNALPDIDYEAVNSMKQEYLRLLYKENRGKTSADPNFASFFSENKEWLEPYALFSILRDRYGTADFNLWEGDSVFSKELMEKYCKDEAEALGYYYFVQYHLHCQLIKAREYARDKGVAFKGDIPIGVSRTSVDVWVNPSLFHLNAQAGAPPDAFSAMGQNWGFPTYNWDEMAKDNYKWWKERFKKMAAYFDAYRIDHILGFFRIWEIPIDAVHGVLGYFSPALPFSAHEICNNYGFPFTDNLAEPVINDWIIGYVFEGNAEYVLTTYFDRNQDNSLRFKQQYNSQLKIVQSTEESKLRDNLLSLFNERLFIADPRKVGYFHPRISAQSTLLFRALSQEHKEMFNKLYYDFFYHRHNHFWKQEALRKLPSLIRATKMLVCGEDLGMIPHCVPNVMEQLKILSLEIQRMPKDDTKAFDQPSSYAYHSVCTTSTHDMNPIRAWLMEDKEQSKLFLEQTLGVHNYEIVGDAPDWICELIINQHIYSASQWCILPLQDWLSMDSNIRIGDAQAERINIPANSRHYWKYRMHISIEELMACETFNTKLRTKLIGAKR